MKKQEHSIKRMLRRGDAAIIAGMTGYHTRTIRAMIVGERPMHPLVLHAAQKLIEARKRKIDEQASQYK
jgi:hypothetical protein